MDKTPGSRAKTKFLAICGKNLVVVSRCPPLPEYEFLEPAELSLLTERRRHGPWGLGTGEAGAPGENYLNNEVLPAKTSVSVSAGDKLLIQTPGGGGWENA